MAKVFGSILCRNAGYWYVQLASNRLGDVFKGYALITNAMQSGAGWCNFKCYTKQTCRIEFMHSRPAIGSFTNVAEDPHK